MIRIMVVDDERDVQLLFQQRFRKEVREGQMEFHFAFSGESALEYLTEHGVSDIALLLSDINMPGMSGLDLLRIAKERYATLKVFMITAYGDAGNYQAALRYGSDEYFTKPIDFNELKEKLVRLNPAA